MEKEQIITGIEKGWGESSTFYQVGSGSITKITREVKPTEYNCDGIIKETVVYRVWEDEKLALEFESNSCITLYF